MHFSAIFLDYFFCNYVFYRLEKCYKILTIFNSSEPDAVFLNHFTKTNSKTTTKKAPKIHE